jgi:putative CocE/NonD family hydrolase
MRIGRRIQAVALVGAAIAFLGAGAVVLAFRYTNIFRPIPPPSARYSVRLQKDVMVRMRDGIELSTDLYFPEAAGERLPVVLMRTPYNKSRQRGHGAPPHIFAGQGYVVAVQDVRGRFASGGLFRVSSAQEGLDGYDTVTWLASQKWCNGRVGTFGCSYLGEVQYMLAALRHPNHAAAIPQAGCAWGGSGVRAFGFRRYGVLELAAAFGWFRTNGSKVYPVPPVPPVDYASALKDLPVADLMRMHGGPPSDFRDIASRPSSDPYWHYMGDVTPEDRFNVPALHVNSWYDPTPNATLSLFNAMKENAESKRARDNQFLVMSPAGHCESEELRWPTRLGRRWIGDPRLDYWGLYIRWFDHWLKGIDNGVTSEPRIRYYVMGLNEWRTASEWPLPRTRFTPYYLDSRGRANTLGGDGSLVLGAPTSEATDEFVYDPGNPVPTLGGTLCCVGRLAADPGAWDQSNIERRQDVLVYTTPPLQRGIEVTGPVRAVLYVSSSAPDTDFVAKLVDVYPDGRAYNIQEGVIRARYRKGLDEEVWMEPDGVYELGVDLEATSNFFGAGHRIRLEVTSSSFPRWERNLNTGGRNYDERQGVAARNRIHHSSRYPSHLLLPIIP